MRIHVVSLSIAISPACAYNYAHMHSLIKIPGRPPDISDEEIRILRNLLATGALDSTRAVQSYLSRKVLGFKNDEAVSLKTTRKCMCRAGYPPRVPRTGLSMTKIRICELKECPRELKQLVAPILEVVAGVPIREAARRAGMDQRTLRDRFCRVRDKGLHGLSLPHGKLREVLFAWCDRVKRPTVKKAVAHFGKRLQKSPRTLDRYVMHWKDSRGIPRRHWTCGGSKHSGLSGL
jgi:hypothetical protein